jgi:hypothetical protein
MRTAETELDDHVVIAEILDQDPEAIAALTMIRRTYASSLWWRHTRGQATSSLASAVCRTSSAWVQEPQQKYAAVSSACGER